MKNKKINIANLISSVVFLALSLFGFLLCFIVNVHDKILIGILLFESIVSIVFSSIALYYSFKPHRILNKPEIEDSDSNEAALYKEMHDNISDAMEKRKEPWRIEKEPFCKQIKEGLPKYTQN